MGIKFLCPNGHKLHVKSFLSGKRAICPKCGERVVVPAESTSGSPTNLQRGDDSGSTSSAEPDESMLLDVSQSVATSAAAPAIAQPAASSPASDPIAESPSAVWYVRPPSGGQFGPASGEIMRGWINDGRVGASSLVWRAGWSEWRSAAATFPQLSSLLVAPGPPLQQVALPSNPTASAANLPRGHVAEMLPPGPPEVSATVPPLAEMTRKRRRKKDVSLLASAVLVAVTVILIIILVLVFRAQSVPKTPDIEPTPAAITSVLDLTPISSRG